MSWSGGEHCTPHKRETEWVYCDCCGGKIVKSQAIFQRPWSQIQLEAYGEGFTVPLCPYCGPEESPRGEFIH